MIPDFFEESDIRQNFLLDDFAEIGQVCEIQLCTPPITHTSPLLLTAKTSADSVSDDEKSSDDKSPVSTPKRRKQSEPGFQNRTGHWEIMESKRYHWFLETHSKHFLNTERRRADKIFKVMAAFIETREAEQCRSHHQKMEKKCKSYYKILRHLREIHYSSLSKTCLQKDLVNHNLKCPEDLVSQQELLRRSNEFDSPLSISTASEMPDPSNKSPNRLFLQVTTAKKDSEINIRQFDLNQSPPLLPDKWLLEEL